MKLISRDKLTDFDTQVLTLTGLLGTDWRLKGDGMAHFEVGEFKKSLYGFGMQVTELNANTSRYRRLSWRGQILLRCEYRRMLVAKLPDLPKMQAMDTQAAPQPSLSGLQGPPGNPFGALGQTAREYAIKQQQQQVQLQNLQAKYAEQLQVNLADLVNKGVTVARDDLLDAQKYAFTIKAEAKRPPLVAKPDNFI